MQLYEAVMLAMGGLKNKDSSLVLSDYWLNLVTLQHFFQRPIPSKISNYSFAVIYLE